MKATSWLTLIGLVAVIGFVLYTSFEVGRFHCDVCVQFNGGRACRGVDGDDENDTRQSAIINACALVASGVTDSMACQRTTPTKSDCSPR